MTTQQKKGINQMTPKEYREIKAALKAMQTKIAIVKKQIAAMENKKPKVKKCEFSTPQYLYRDDNKRFSRNKDGTYSMDDSGMANPYRYTYGRLMETGAFSAYGA